MSLVVKLNRFKVLKCKNEKYARLEFRGSLKYSASVMESDEIIHVNQRFEWIVHRPVGPGEVLTLSLMSRARWSSPRTLGVYRLGLQILVNDGQLSITDTLVDDHNRAVPVFVEMDVFYTAPKYKELLPTDESGYIIDAPSCSRSHRDSVQPAVHGASPGSSHAPVHSTHASVHTSAHGSAHGSAHSSAHGSAHGSVHGSAHSSAPPSDGDEENALTYIEKNIASLERTMQRTVRLWSILSQLMNRGLVN
ncbi:otoferlin-like [Manduca sexta]|uniref:otoferlin-like n=1 Tax=Manduca sexta TaxID=7130 RepID=UPI00188E7310|nr:otoferlin-like [Manduca sexta]